MLKLDYKRTFYTSLGVMGVFIVFQVLETYMSVFLSDLFVKRYGGIPSDHTHMVGIILGAGNFFTLVCAPLISYMSDKTKSRLGKRMPYIMLGTILVAILLPLLPFLYMANNILWFVLVLQAVVVIADTYRVPMVALMPDITPKPLRNKASGFVDLMGYIGIIIVGIMAVIFPAKLDTEGFLSYDPATIWVPFVVTAVLMVAFLIVMVLKIKENKLAIDLKEDMLAGEKLAETDTNVTKETKLSKFDKRNLTFMLLAIFFWNLSFAAVQNYGAIFGLEVLDVDTGWWGIVTISLTVFGMLSMLPAGNLANKIGRKATIILGLVLIIVPFLVACFIKTPWLFYIAFAFAGAGWAIINVVSYPMVVEFASEKNLAKFTSQYYFFKTLAYCFAPILSSIFITHRGYSVLFIYATVVMLIAIICFAFYRKPNKIINDQSNTKQGSEKQVNKK